MSPTPEPNPTRPSRRPAMVIIQIVGFAIGIALLGYAVREALRPENREQLARLSQATPGEILLLLALATLSVGFNGFIFWAIINPVHRIRCTDVIATNAIATFLAYLPFKLSVVARFVIHNRRDKVPVLTIGAWLMAAAILMLAAFAPFVLASIWQKEVNALWWLVSLTGVALCTVVGSALARQLAGDVGIARLARVGFGPRITGSGVFTRLHTGFDMLGHPRGALIANGVRLLDIFSFALRFYVAARVLDLPLSGQDALLLGACYFLIGAASPSGMLGTREAGIIAIAALVGISSAAVSQTASGQTPIAAVVLFVTAVEAVVNLGCAGFGIAWLRARPGLSPDPDDHPDMPAGKPTEASPAAEIIEAGLNTPPSGE